MVFSSSQRSRFRASAPNQVSPVATSSMTSLGRCCFTNVLNSVRTSSMSALDFSTSAFSIFFVGVSVRLNLPAVTVWNSTPSFFSRSYTLGISEMTPMDPSTANGDATSRSAVHAIMYPPLAATCSTQIVSLMPASLSRVSCAAASP